MSRISLVKLILIFSILFIRVNEVDKWFMSQSWFKKVCIIQGGGLAWDGVRYRIGKWFR